MRKDKYGSYALVTGASSGIGKEFAGQLAAYGFNIALAARRKDKLQQIAMQLQNKYSIQTKVIEVDLSNDEGVTKLENETKDLDIGLAVLNAGISTTGSFIKNNIDAENKLIRVNLLTPVQLAHHYGNLMAEKKRGGIIFLSSTIGTAAAPYLANYAASKAYIFSFGQALNYELKKYNVDVTVLAPGPTKTEGFDTTDGIDFNKMPVPAMNVKQVVKVTLDGLGSKAIVIPGALNKVMDFMGKYATPRSTQRWMYGNLLTKAIDKNLL